MKKITLLLVALFGLGIGTGKGQYSVLFNFNGRDGANPAGGLTFVGNKFYGMTAQGGIDDNVIFSIDSDGSNFSILHNINSEDGAQSSLTLSGNKFYGIISQGGLYNSGYVFSIDTNGSAFDTLHNMNDSNGGGMEGSLLLSRGVLYGTTSHGFPNNYYGTIFSIDTNGSQYHDMFDFNDTTGGTSYCTLVLSGNKLFGTTLEGGANNDGCIFSIDTNGNEYKDIFDFNGTNGRLTQNALTLSASGKVLYGTSEMGGAFDSGCIFKIDTNGAEFKVLFNCNTSSGSIPSGGSLLLLGSTLWGMESRGGRYLSGCIYSIDTNGSGYTDMFDFNGTNGKEPWGSLIVLGNIFYGATVYGAPNNDGVIFRYIPCNFNVTIISTISCNGSANATATATPSGGTSPYTYNWNNGQTNATATGLSAGIYIVNVTDSVGCSGSAVASISQPPVLQDSINSQCATCCNCKGTTHVYVWGGTPPYTYSWSNGRTNDTLMGLASGSYTATITDSNGCVINDTVFVSHGDHVSASQVNILCNGESDGSAAVSVDGSFSYSWSPGGETTSSIGGLSAGVYSVTLTNLDTTGCSATYSFNISQPQPLMASPELIPYDPNNICGDTTCFLVNVAGIYGGTPPYTYSVDNYQLPICYSGLGAYINATDAHGCRIDTPLVYTMGTSIRVQINNNVSCYGGNNGSATINENTGDPPGSPDITFNWSPGGGTNQTETNLSAGTYTVTVTNNSEGCTVSAVIAITQPPPLFVTADSINATTGNCNGSAWAIVSGGTAPYTYSWTGGLSTDTISSQCADYYCCTLTDANGCIDSVCTNIETSTGTKQLIMDNEQLTIYPNPNDGKFTLQINNGKLIIDNERPLLEVYNVLGEKVYSELSIVNCQLLIDLSSQPNGVYFYRALYQNGGLIGEGKLIIQK